MYTTLFKQVWMAYTTLVTVYSNIFLDLTSVLVNGHVHYLHYIFECI